jgi:hypothetical protein
MKLTKTFSPSEVRNNNNLEQGFFDSFVYFFESCLTCFIINFAIFPAPLNNSLPSVISPNKNQPNGAEHSTDPQAREESTEQMKGVEEDKTNLVTTTNNTNTNQNNSIPTLESILTTSQREMNDGIHS